MCVRLSVSNQYLVWDLICGNWMQMEFMLVLVSVYLNWMTSIMNEQCILTTCALLHYSAAVTFILAVLKPESEAEGILQFTCTSNFLC